MNNSNLPRGQSAGRFRLGMLSFLVASLTALSLEGAEPWTLPRAIQCALTNNPDSRLAQQRILAAQAGWRQAQAAFSPQLQFQSSYLRTDNPMLVFGSILNLLGIEQGDFAVADSAPAMTAPDSGDFSRRPELAAYQHRQHAAEAEVRKARSGHLPRLDAFASADYDYGWKFDGDGESYTAGLMLQWDLWDGQLTRAKIQEAETDRNVAAAALRKALGLPQLDSPSTRK